MTKKIDICCRNELIAYKLYEDISFFNYEYKQVYNIGNCLGCGKLHIQQGILKNNKFVFQKQFGNAVKKFSKIKNNITEYIKEPEIRKSNKKGSYQPSWVYGVEDKIKYLDTNNIVGSRKAEIKIIKITP